MRGRTTQELVQLLSNGAILVMNTRGFAKDDLLQLVRNSKSTITFTGLAGLNHDDLLQIIRVGGGRVILSDAGEN
jgi:hypothetical protein